MNRPGIAVRAFGIVLLALAPAAALAAAGSGADDPDEVTAGQREQAEQSAIAVMNAFMTAFNARDESAWADTLLFPHVRMASHEVAVYPDKRSFVAASDLDAFAASTGWDHSRWDDLRVIQVSPEKVHIAVTFTRFDSAGAAMASYQSMYVVERLDGRWGIRARSSFAP